MAKARTRKNDTTANLGYEAQLWQMADALRNKMDAAEYKHVVLGLIFLKYISDAFEDKHAELEAQKAQGADPEDRDEYRAAIERDNPALKGVLPKDFGRPNLDRQRLGQIWPGARVNRSTSLGFRRHFDFRHVLEAPG